MASTPLKIQAKYSEPALLPGGIADRLSRRNIAERSALMRGDAVVALRRAAQILYSVVK